MRSALDSCFINVLMLLSSKSTGNAADCTTVDASTCGNTTVGGGAHVGVADLLL